jgi:hypothetical protein
MESMDLFEETRERAMIGDPLIKYYNKRRSDVTVINAIFFVRFLAGRNFPGYACVSERCMLFTLLLRDAPPWGTFTPLFLTKQRSRWHLFALNDE